MTTGGHDLGHGVYVSPSDSGQLVVLSPRFDLGWKAASGKVPGTAVLWQDQPFEVVARTAAGKGDRWTLRPWHGDGAMRVVLRLDEQLVEETAERHSAERKGGRNRLVTVLLMPILGLAPGSIQQQWHSEWLFPAELASWVSSIVELLVGSLGLMQALAMAFGGDWFLPAPLRFLVVVGPLMCIEAIVRAAQVGANPEPAGSVMGLPFKLLEEKAVATGDATEPEVRLLDEEGGVLELVSPVNRTDWNHDGRLAYRGRWYGLELVDREGRGWRYRFTLLQKVDGEHPVLHLRAPAGTAFVPPRLEKPPPSIFKTTLVTAAVTLGPRRDQERWADHLDVRAKWLTAASAVAELIGGLTNISKDAAAGGAFFIAFDILLVGEGLLRLMAALGGRPMGSVFGWILRPLYRSSLPPERP